MIAGCVAATRELKAYLRSTLSGVIIRNPAINLDSWIDDITIECQSKSEQHVKRVTNKAVQDLRQAVDTELLLEFAGLKTTVVASREGLASAVAGAVGDKRVKKRGARYQATQLGVDQTAGKALKALAEQETHSSNTESKKVNAGLSELGESWARGTGKRSSGSEARRLQHPSAQRSTGSTKLG